MMSEPVKCHWNGEGRVTKEHRRGCDTPGCEGCKPCTEPHCTMPRCSRHTDDLCCARCVGKVRDGLERIASLCQLVPVAAAEKGVNSPAVVLGGPVPEHSTHAARHAWAIRGGLCRCGERCSDLQPEPEGPWCEDWKTCAHHVCRRRTGRATCPDLAAWLDQADDERHPLWVLGSWDMLVAEHFGHTRTMRVTVAGAVAYLSANLTDLARHEDFAFDELAREVETTLGYVEEVLSIAPRPQRGAPCPVCHAAGRKAKQLVREYADGEPDDALDMWACPTAACGETWTVEQYDKYVEREHARQAPRLTASQIAAEYRVSEGTLRVWAARGKVRKYGRDTSGRQLYDVADVLRVRDTSAA